MGQVQMTVVDDLTL